MSHEQMLRLRIGAGHNDRAQSFPVPATWSLRICPPRGGPPLSKKQIRRAFARTVGMKPIRQEAKGAQSAVILVDDFRRPTPAETLSHVVIDELIAAGLDPQCITIILGNGAHRVMNRREVARRLGKAVNRVGNVVSHDAFSNKVDFLGLTAAGTPVLINRAATQVDFSVTVSTVYPHKLTGWGGGAKMVLPGIAHVSSSQYHHTQIKAGEWGENPGKSKARRDLEQAADLFGLDASVCAVVNHDKQLCGLRVGHPIRAHRSAVRFARKAYQTVIGGDAPDLVVANAYPLDGDPTQTSKTEIPARRCGAPILMIVDFADACDWHGVYHGPRRPYLARPKPRMPRRSAEKLANADTFMYCPQAADGYVPANPAWYCDHDWDRLIADMSRRFKNPSVLVLPAAPLQIPVRQP